MKFVPSDLRASSEPVERARPVQSPAAGLRPPSLVAPKPREGGSVLRRSGLILLALVAAATAGAQTAPQPTALSDSLKKILARFPRTEERVKLLVGRRLDPQPLPATLPNPFYRGVEPSDLQQLTVNAPPAADEPPAPDITDADTLARLAPTLRITGLVSVNGVPHVAVNGSVCKVGDVIPLSNRDNPIFIQVRHIGAHEITVGLHDAELTIQVKL
jgi:uncharacterized Zn-binding protein involved in type VI secretion